MTPTIPGSRSLRLARIITLSLILLIMGMYIPGFIAHTQALQQVCLDSEAVCQQTPTQLTPEEFASLQASGLSLSAYATLEALKLLIYSIIWWGVGGLILLRTPNQWMALVVAFTLMTFPTQVDNLPDALAAAYPSIGLLVQFIRYLINLGLPLFVALFPNGRWSPHWVRWIIILMVLLSLPQFFAPNWMVNLGLSDVTALLAELAVSLGGLGLLLVAQVIRYRRFSTPIERLQARWVMLGVAASVGTIAALVVVWALGMLPTKGWLTGLIGEIVYQTAIVLIPISVAIAILRYRLFDIDIIIRRTLQYSLLTALLATFYFGSVAMLQGIFTSLGGSQSTAATVISTLAIAAIFNPLRRRLQDFIDRRFYRQKYDAELALAQFNLVARNETDIAQLSSRLTNIVQTAFQPDEVLFWLAPPAKGWASSNRDGGAP